MGQALALFLDHLPFWSWLAIAGMLLIGELMTGSGWLLWPAGSAALVGVVAFVCPLGWPLELVLFVAATVVSTYLGRRFLRPAPKGSHDINDPAPRLLGRQGETVSPFKAGLGRVFVDGKEWAAELDGGGDLAARAKVEVVAILGGARLKVKAA